MSAALPDPEDREAVTALTPALEDVSVDFVAGLAEVDIDLCGPQGWVSVDPGCRYARIGFVVVWDDGEVSAVACVNATAVQVGEVCRQGEWAKLNGPTGPRWRRIPDRGWELSIREPIAADEFPPIARCHRVPGR